MVSAHPPRSPPACELGRPGMLRGGRLLLTPSSRALRPCPAQVRPYAEAPAARRRAGGVRKERDWRCGCKLPACLHAHEHVAARTPARSAERAAHVLDGAPRAGATATRGSSREAASGRRQRGPRSHRCVRRLQAACAGLHGSRVHAHVADHAQGERHSTCFRA